METAKETPAKLGRPPKNPADKQSVGVLVTLTPAESAAVAAAAGSVPVATWCRAVILRAAKRSR